LKYAFIAQHQGEYEVKIMCRVLSVSVSSYYQWRKRPLSARAQENEQLAASIQQIYNDNRRLYGSRRVTAALHKQGWRYNRKRVARLMRLQHLRGCERRKRRMVTTQVAADRPVATNLLQQDFSASAPNQTWLADITYVPTQEGFLYLGSLEDVFSRKIVGWAMDEHMETALVEAALRMALTNRSRITDLVHHSDRGSQYTSLAYSTLLQQQGITPSMSATGNCYDNAMKESFWATLKAECVVQPFATRAQARTAIFEYIEVFYNRQRLHSSLGYFTPDEFEQLYYSLTP
jgi:transposase InsO family protein